MPRSRRFEVAVINITMHPHSPERYVELFQRAATPTQYLRCRGDEQMVLPAVHPCAPHDCLSGLYGWLYRGLDLGGNTGGSLRTLRELDPGDASRIPPEVRARFKSTPFVFLPRGHRLFFCASEGTERFNPAHTAKALRLLLNRPDLQERFGEVAVTIESKEETVEQVLMMPSLTKLMIFVTLPNDDVFSDRDVQRALERLRVQNAKKHRIQMQGRPGAGLKPDRETRAFMRLATSNGRIEAEGYAGGAKIIESTADHPYLIQGKYIPHQEKLIDKIVCLARTYLPRFTHRN